MESSEPAPEIVTDFYGVYLLFCENQQHLGRTYVGYTRNPTRRIMQHNRGTWAGGANRTNNKGPWKMILIIHGFPNNIAALRFEWAWQNPHKSTRLRHLEHRKRIPRKEKEIDFRLRIVSEMLLVGPWCLLPLTVRWLERQYYQPFPDEKSPPTHMQIKHGSVKSKNLSKKKLLASQMQWLCSICYDNIHDNNRKLKCTQKNCGLYFHINCLGDTFLTGGNYVPVSGLCPKCNEKLLWGDLIKGMKCHDLDSSFNSNNDSDESDDLIRSQSLISSDEEV